MPPPTLQQLAMQSLLEDEALAVSALEDLPEDLFPTLFREAFLQRRMEVLKAMVQAWPFPRLPLGALLGREDLEMLEVILEGLEMLLKQKVRPRGCKLQVIDVRSLCRKVWTLGFIAKSRASSAENQSPETTKEPPFKIVVDSLLRDRLRSCIVAHLDYWAQTRRGRVYLCPKDLSRHSPRIQSILHVLHLENADNLWMISW